MKDQQNKQTFLKDIISHKDDCGVWWYLFQKSLQNFVSLVSSKKGHFKVDENLQTLQAIHESRMHYVAMMQQTIQKLNKTVNEQQQVITALKFRYLLENLPGSAYDKTDKLGEKWRKFWGDIVTYYRKRNEDAKQAILKDSGIAEGDASAVEEAAPAEAKALVGREETLIERGDPAKEVVPPTKVEPLLEETLPEGEETTVERVEVVAPAEESTNVKDNYTSTAPALDKLFGGRYESKYESKGRDLYSDLSEIIHRYKGNTYEIPELLFDPITSDILQALTPDQKENGNVEWRKEPLRYTYYNKAVGKWKEEEKKTAEKAEAADPVIQEKKKQQKNVVQSLGAGLKALKDRLQELERELKREVKELKREVKELEREVKELKREVKELKATGPVNAGDTAEQVNKSPDPNSDDEYGFSGTILDHAEEEQGISSAANE